MDYCKAQVSQLWLDTKEMILWYYDDSYDII